MPMLLPKSSDLNSYIVILIQQVAGFLGTVLASSSIDSSLGRKGTEFIAFLLSGLTMYPFMWSQSTEIVKIN